MKRLPITALMLAALVATAALVLPSAAGPAAAADPQDIVVKVGDHIVVDGHPLGCRVAELGGSVIVDCRRGGRLAGTYGTMLSSRKAMTVRFRSNAVAKVVFTATHNGGARRCR